MYYHSGDVYNVIWLYLNVNIWNKYLLFMFTFVAFLFPSLMLTSGNGIISLLKTEILKCLSYCTLIPVCIYIWSFKTLVSTLSILWPIQGLTIRGHSDLGLLPTELSVYRDHLHIWQILSYNVDPFLRLCTSSQSWSVHSRAS